MVVVALKEGKSKVKVRAEKENGAWMRDDCHEEERKDRRVFDDVLICFDLSFHAE